MATIERIGKYLLLRSNDVVSGQPKLPTTSQVEEGELALNFHKGVETISTINDNNEIVTFSSDDQVKEWISASGGSGGGEVNVITAITYNNSAVPVTNKVAAITGTTGTITGINMNGASKGTSGVVDLGTVITSETQLSTGTTTGNGNVVTNISVSNHQITMSKSITIPNWATASTKPTYTASEVGALPTGTTLDNVADGTTRKLSDYATQANFTAHTGDTSVHFTTGDVKTQIESYGYTTNTGTVTGIKMNGASKGTSGVVDLGTVITGETQLSTGTTTGNGNVVTNISVSNHQITMAKSITIPNWATASTKPSYTANEVGALPTGTTLDDVADGTTRKLSNYATQANFTAHTASTTVHVSTSEKNTWNGKQDAISDLDTIRKQAASGATAYTNVTAHTGNGDIHVTAAQKTNWNTAYNNRVTGATITSGTTNSASFANNVVSITAATVPTYSASDSGKILSVDSTGKLVWITPAAIYSGSGTPAQNIGQNGDIYLQTS